VERAVDRLKTKWKKRVVLFKCGEHNIFESGFNLDGIFDRVLIPVFYAPGMR
jgi:hypothetical protein